jgi:hypothetical protein
VTTIFALCPACNACPTVEINDHEVRIGEGDNVVKLTLLSGMSSCRRSRQGT